MFSAASHCSEIDVSFTLRDAEEMIQAKSISTKVANFNSIATDGMLPSAQSNLNTALAVLTPKPELDFESESTPTITQF